MRNDLEIEALRLTRLHVHEQREALGRAVAQPFVDGEAVALRLRDLLPLLVEEEFVVEPLGRLGAEGARDLRGQLD